MRTIDDVNNYIRNAAKYFLNERNYKIKKK